MSPPPAEDADARRRRRAWILAHHPDRGGDPAAFVAGLARLDAGDDPDADGNFSADGAADPDRPTVYRSRTPWRRGLRLVRTARRLLTNQPRSRGLR